jgi:predicted Na+-dependent transporter
MHGSAQDPEIIKAAIVLAVVAFVFRRALLKLAVAILAIVAIVMMGSGAVVIFDVFRH